MSNERRAMYRRIRTGAWGIPTVALLFVGASDGGPLHTARSARKSPFELGPAAARAAVDWGFDADQDGLPDEDQTAWSVTAPAWVLWLAPQPGENMLDYRQTRKEPILILPTINPRFKQLWAPIDGRVLNLSLKLSI